MTLLRSIIAACRRRQSAPPATVDPYFANRVLALHCDGDDASTSFPDESPSPKTVSVVSGARVTASSFKFGGGALDLNGFSWYLNVPASADFDFGTGDFTIALWVKNSTGGGGLISQVSGSGFFDLSLIGGDLVWRVDGTPLITRSFSGLTIWTHVAVVRRGTDLEVYYNASREGFAETDATATGNATADVRIGLGADDFLSGQMDDILILKGVALDSTELAALVAAPFLTPPDPDFADVALLVHCDGAPTSQVFTDLGPNAHTITANGTAQVNTTTKVFGSGSLQLDADTGNFLSVPGHARFALNGDFTIELRYRPHATPLFQSLIDIGGYDSGISLRANQSGGDITLFAVGAMYSKTFTWVLDTWYYVVAKRSGTTITLEIDGVQIGTSETNAFTFSSGTPALRIGNVLSGGAAAQDRHIDEVRITRKARNTSTIPAAPFPNS